MTTGFLMFLMQSAAFAQGSDEGKDIASPWTMGNIIVVLFALALFALVTRSSRRDFSAIPDEFGNRPNAKNQKKKKGKQKLDFSKGPIQHPDLNNALILTLLAWFCGFLVFFSLPAATRVRDEIKGDPRFLGGGMATAIVVINYIIIVSMVLGIIGTIAFFVLGGFAGEAAG